MIYDVSPELDNNKFSLVVFIDHLTSLKPLTLIIIICLVLKNVSLWNQRHRFTMVHQLLK